MVLLVLGDKIVHVGFCFREFHLVHALTSVPVQESFAPEHGGELLGNSLEEFLDGSGITNESGRHFQTSRRNVANGSLDVVRNPFNEVRRILVLNVQHLLVDLLHRHASTEHGGNSEVSAVARVAGCHHVLGIEHLLSQFRNGEGSVLLGSAGRQGSETRHEEMQTWEWDHVYSELSQIGIQLTREPELRKTILYIIKSTKEERPIYGDKIPETSRNAGHRKRYQMV